MNELETYKQLYSLMKEEIFLLKKSLAASVEQVGNLSDLVANQEKIIDLQKEIIDELSQKREPHLRLVKNKNE